MNADLGKPDNEDKEKTREQTETGKKSLNILDKEADKRKYKKEKEKENNVEKVERKTREVANIRYLSLLFLLTSIK